MLRFISKCPLWPWSCWVRNKQGAQSLGVVYIKRRGFLRGTNLEEFSLISSVLVLIFGVEANRLR